VPRTELDKLLDDGQALEERFDWPAAMAHYTELSERFPNDPRAFNKRGVIHIRMGDRSQAEDAFNEALAIDPDFPPALTNIGSLRLEEGRLEEAVAWYQRALRADPDYPGALNNLAVAYRRQGRLGEAVALMKRAGRQTALRESRRSRERLGCATSGATVVLLMAGGLGLLIGLHL
jgi:tetratricopeptide (TPR) repeat protein